MDKNAHIQNTIPASESAMDRMSFISNLHFPNEFN
jgi:hypothetical protein